MITVYAILLKEKSMEKYWKSYWTEHSKQMECVFPSGLKQAYSQSMAVSEAL